MKGFGLKGFWSMCRSPLVTILMSIIWALLQIPDNGQAELSGIAGVSAGGNHTCVVTTAGGGKCWGSNGSGRLGDGSTTDRMTAVDVADISSGVTAITAGGTHSCVLTTTGGIKCWGSNANGQLGDGTTTDRTTAVDVAGLTSGVTAITVGNGYTCLVTTAGGVKCWGWNDYGQLGDGTTTQRTTAVDVTGLTSGVTAVTAGDRHACAGTTAGGVKCWGYNLQGQLGDGTTTQRTTAVDVIGLATGIEAVIPGNAHTCALTTQGGIKCWGDNYYGQLGDGSNTDRLTAIDVTNLTSGVATVIAGLYHTCAMTTMGGTKCWGSNAYGQLGDGSMTWRTTAGDVANLTTGVAAVTSTGNHTCALTSAGGVRCWGSNEYGQLGDGTNGLMYAPIDAAGLTAGQSAISVSTNASCAVNNTGGVVCWGYDDTEYSSGISVISLGSSHACIVTTSGGAKCRGSNTFGQLGDGTTVAKPSDVDVLGLTNGVSSITVGDYHSCALTTSGGVKCWGFNGTKQIGDGTFTNRSAAVNVTGLTSGVSSISGDLNHTCAVTSAGGAKCWGWNAFGQLGDGSTSDRGVAVNVSGLTSGVSSISADDYHSCALLTSSGVKCWGANDFGQLGDGSLVERHTAVDVVGFSSGASVVSAGKMHTCAVTTAGAAKCWGWNLYGQLGDGSMTDRYTPSSVMGFDSGVVTIGSGDEHTCAITTVGGVKCWGSARNGKLGDDSQLTIRTVLQGLKTSGIVRLSGSPLSGVALRVSGLAPLYVSQQTVSDIDGVYELPIVETATYTITPELNGYTFAPPSISGTMSGDISQDFVATLITYNITGTVTANGNPLSGATVDGGALGTCLTDASGNYAFNTVTPATAYTLTLSHSGATFGVNTASGTLNSHATHDFSGTLHTYDITGNITAGGNPLPGVSINGGGLGNTTTDSSGNYSFAGVDYGTSYTITPSLADYDFSPVSASGTLSGNVTADFTGVYNPPTTSTTSVPTTTVSTTTGPTTSVVTTSIVSSTTTQVATTLPTTTSVEATTTSPISTVTTTTTTSVQSSSSTTSVEASTTISGSTSSVATTSTPSDGNADTDNDGLTDDEEETLGTDISDADTDDDGVIDGEEAQSGTNPKDPGSKQQKLRTTICSEWNGYLGSQAGQGIGQGMFNIMEHVNLTTKKLRVKTELRSIRGHLKDTYEFFLRGNQQFDLLVHNMAGRELNSYGQVCTTYDRAPAGSLDGRMVYYKFNGKFSGKSGANNDIQFAFALPFENPTIGQSALLYNTHQPSLDPDDTGNLVANWVQLSNVSKKRLRGKLYFHNLDGAQLTKPLDVNLRDGSRYDYSAHAYGASQAGLVRFVPTDKTVEYQLRGVRYLYDNAGMEDSFASAYPFNATVGSGQTLIAPVDATVAGETVTSAILELSNTLPIKASVSVKFYDRTGKKILYSKTHVLKAFGSIHLSLDTHIGQAEGLVVVKGAKVGTKIGSVIGSVVHYGRTARGALQNMFAVPLREPVGMTLKGSYNTYLNQGCILYLANSATAKEKVRVSLRQSDGATPIGDYSLTVPAKGVVADNLCAKLKINAYGGVTVSATHQNRIYAVIVRNGEGERYKMATVMR